MGLPWGRLLTANSRLTHPSHMGARSPCYAGWISVEQPFRCRPLGCPVFMRHSGGNGPANLREGMQNVFGEGQVIAAT
jgi:hypothetical protein